MNNVFTSVEKAAAIRWLALLSPNAKLYVAKTVVKIMDKQIRGENEIWFKLQGNKIFVQEKIKITNPFDVDAQYALKEKFNAKSNNWDQIYYFAETDFDFFQNLVDANKKLNSHKMYKIWFLNKYQKTIQPVEKVFLQAQHDWLEIKNKIYQKDRMEANFQISLVRPTKTKIGGNPDNIQLKHHYLGLQMQANFWNNIVSWGKNLFAKPAAIIRQQLTL